MSEQHTSHCPCCHEDEHTSACHHDGDACACHAHPASCKVPPKPFFANPQSKDHGMSLGKDVELEIAQAMKKRYQRFLSRTESFSVVTEVCHQFGLVSAHLSNPERTTCVDFEVCIECEPNEIDNPMDAYQMALDGLDTIILEFFDCDRIAHYLPIWQSYDLDGHTAYIRLERSNPALDDEASAFLRAHGFTEGGLLPDDGEDDVNEPEVDEDPQDTNR